MLSTVHSYCILKEPKRAHVTVKFDASIHLYISTVRVVLTLGLPCLLIYLSLGYAWRVFAFVFLLLFYFFPSPPIRSGEVFSSVIIFFLSFSFVCVFWM